MGSGTAILTTSHNSNKKQTFKTNIFSFSLKSSYVQFTCGGEYLSVRDGGPFVVVWPSWGRLVEGAPEEAGDGEEAPAVSEDAGKPVVVLMGTEDRPADVTALCAVSVQLTLQLLCLHPLHILQQIQL